MNLASSAGDPSWSRLRPKLVCHEAWRLRSNNYTADYSLLISKRYSWLGLRPPKLSRDRNHELINKKKSNCLMDRDTMLSQLVRVLSLQYFLTN